MEKNQRNTVIYRDKKEDEEDAEEWPGRRENLLALTPWRFFRHRAGFAQCRKKHIASAFFLHPQGDEHAHAHAVQRSLQLTHFVLPGYRNLILKIFAVGKLVT